MKRLMALFVLGLFLISIVPVFAHDAERNRELRVRGLSEFGMNASEIEHNNALARERHELLKEKFLEAKVKFMESKEVFLSERANIKSKIDEIKSLCESNPNSERCSQMKENFIRGDAKTYLLHALDTIENVLEKRKAKIEEIADANMTASVKAGLDLRLTEIDNELEVIAQIRSKVEAATTKEEIKDAARELRREWKNIKVHLELSAGHVLSNRFAFVIHRAESLEKKLDNTLLKLQSKGYDVSVVDADVQDFKAHIERAKELATEAKAKFNEAKAEENNTELRDGHNLLVEAHDELKLAHEGLKEILSKLKATAGSEVDVELETSSNSTAGEETSSDETQETDAGASVNQSQQQTNSDTSAGLSVSVNTSAGVA